MSTAGQIMRYQNPNAVIGEENNAVCMIEDWSDPDGRMYRMEYQSTPDGRHALAYCLSNPWDRQRPNAGMGYAESHVASDGLLCMGTRHVKELKSSPYDIETVISRARYWCTGFSVLKETGEFPQL